MLSRAMRRRKMFFFMGVFISIPPAVYWIGIKRILMFRRHAILVVAVAMMVTFIVPPSLARVCVRAQCPMQLARAMAQEKQAKVPSCCLKNAPLQSTDATSSSLSTPCCCKIQPVTDAPSAVGMLLVEENTPAVLSVPITVVVAPVATAISLPNTLLAVTAPRGPPLPFASLRAPPFIF
jgi:hypothetical protein